MHREYATNTDGSWVEDKEVSCEWHFDAADVDFGKMQATDLEKYLHKVLPEDIEGLQTNSGNFLCCFCPASSIL